MRQSIVLSILFVLVGSPSFASPKEIMQVYENFSQQKKELLKADLNKKNIKETVAKYTKNLSISYEEVKKLEAKSKSVLLTPEGNQMAYEIEILEPIRDLASSKMTKEDCMKAKHEHELNFPVVKDDESAAIENLINKVCN